MHVHLVFVSKYRRGVFDVSAIRSLRTVFTGVCEDFAARLVEMNGEEDHDHLLVEYFAEGGRIQAREQPQGRLEPPAAQGTTH